MKYAAILLLAGVAYGQRHLGSSHRGGYSGGIQSLQSSPLPPAGYVSPSVLREKSEPPKPFAYKYEGPDPYGGYSSHESQGDEYGRITGQYTVQNPDGTSRVVKYVADPEYGFHAEVDTDEEGTKTSEPANALIKSSAPEEGYQPQVKKSAYGSPAPGAYAGSGYKAGSSLKAPAYKSATYAKPGAYQATKSYGGAYNTGAGGYNPASSYRAPTAAYRAPAPVASPYRAGSQYGGQGAYRAGSQYGSQGAYRAGSQYGGQGAYRAGSQYGGQGAYRAGSQYGGQGAYKAAASYQAPTAYRAPASVYSHQRQSGTSTRPYY